MSSSRNPDPEPLGSLTKAADFAFKHPSSKKLTGRNVGWLPVILSNSALPIFPCQSASSSVGEGTAPLPAFSINSRSECQFGLGYSSLGEDKFLGEVARLGHGMQRSFLVALLHELAMSNGENGPTLLLGMEEPELYQHPSQALHISDVLQELSQNTTTNSQVIISTHSPHFVSSRGFESVRVVRKHLADKCSLVASTTFTRIEGLIAAALGTKPDLPSVTMTAMEQIMQPSQRELYFTKFAILVEGIEDVAFIATHLHVTGKWHEFRKHGCHFIVAMGKTNLSRPIAIARELCIPHFIVFDGDGDKKNKDEQARDNLCILKLSDIENPQPFSDGIQWHRHIVVWPKSVFDAVKDDFGANVWDQAEQKARKERGYVVNVKQKNNMLIAAVIEELAAQQKFSATLTKLCELIFQRAGEARQDPAQLIENAA